MNRLDTESRMALLSDVAYIMQVIVFTGLVIAMCMAFM